MNQCLINIKDRWWSEQEELTMYNNRQLTVSNEFEFSTEFFKKLFNLFFYIVWTDLFSHITRSTYWRYWNRFVNLPVSLYSGWTKIALAWTLQCNHSSCPKNIPAICFALSITSCLIKIRLNIRMQNKNAKSV